MRSVIAVVGAECSGKSTLAEALGRTLPAVVVPEHLREFVEVHGRPPTRGEQASIMAAQIAAEERARATAAPPALVVSDAGALMTAVYSMLYFEDASLLGAAIEHHRRAYVLTVWCDVDLPWIEDGAQRDGEEFRRRGHDILAGVLKGAPFDLVMASGGLDDRVRVVTRAIAMRAARASLPP